MENPGIKKRITLVSAAATINKNKILTSIGFVVVDLYFLSFSNILYYCNNHETNHHMHRGRENLGTPVTIVTIAAVHTGASNFTFYCEAALGACSTIVH